MEIATLTLNPRGADRAYALALICQAVCCRTGEEIRDDGLVLHVVGPKSVTVMLWPVLIRLAHVLPEESVSWLGGFGTAIGRRLAEQTMIPDGCEEAVDAAFVATFMIVSDTPGHPRDDQEYHDGQASGLGYDLFKRAIAL